MQRQYLCIDLKSFFASVECADRGLDAMTTNLVVADPERHETTICLAVSPSMKKLGVRNRCRVYEIPKGIEYIMAPPRMQLYIDYAAEIYGVYLKYVSKDDMHVYSIDEVFIDVTDYLSTYGMSARQLGEMIRADVYKETGVPAACGVGDNLYLAKIALDITAKHSPDFIGELDEEKYRQTLWDHRPITDFWHVGSGTAKRLENRGIYTMGAVAACPEKVLYKLFGVNAEILIDHAWGREPITIADIKSYKTDSHSIGSGQVLPRAYTFDEAIVIIREMTEQLCMRLVDEECVARSVTLSLSYSNKELASTHGTEKFDYPTSSRERITAKTLSLYKRIYTDRAAVRRINITINDVISEGYEQLDLFCDSSADIQEKKQMQTIISIKKRFGKNAILRAADLKKEATARERNRQIGGHKSGK